MVYSSQANALIYSIQPRTLCPFNCMNYRNQSVILSDIVLQVMKSRRQLLDYGIVFVCRAVRGFFAGVFALLLFENLLLRGLSFADVGRLQLCLLAGCLLAAKLAARLAGTLGVVNTLILASLAKCAATLAFAHAKSAGVLSTAATFGCFAVYDGWFCPFLALERTALAQLAKDPAKTDQQYKGRLSKLLGFHNAIGGIAQAGGMLFAGYSLHHNFYVLFMSYKEIGELILTYSALSAFACLVLYALLDRSKIQADISDAEIYTNSPGSFLASLVYCLQGVSASIFSQSYLIYLIRIGFIYSYINIIPTLAIFVCCSTVGFIMFVLLRPRINGLFLYLLTSVVPNIMVLISSFLTLYQDPFRILMQLVLLFGCAAYSQRPSLIRKLFPGTQQSSINWLVAAGYLAGGAIGLMLQQRYNLNYRLIFIAGASRLLLDVIVLACYARKRREIGPFSNLFQEAMPRNTENGNKEIVCQEEV